MMQVTESLHAVAIFAHCTLTFDLVTCHDLVQWEWTMGAFELAKHQSSMCHVCWLSSYYSVVGIYLFRVSYYRPFSTEGGHDLCSQCALCTRKRDRNSQVRKAFTRKNWKSKILPRPSVKLTPLGYRDKYVYHFFFSRIVKIRQYWSRPSYGWPNF